MADKNRVSTAKNVNICKHGCEPADYEVGYGRPPLEHQFKKGRSGNPRGRRRGSRNKPKLDPDRLPLLVYPTMAELRELAKAKVAEMQREQLEAALGPEMAKLVLKELAKKRGK